MNEVMTEPIKHEWPDFNKSKFPGYDAPHLCNCMGPQNGQPLCPCAMRSIVVRDGRYIRPEQDLGPVK